MLQAYCFKCKTKREVANPIPVPLKNGRAAISGSCPVCNTKVFRIVGKRSVRELAGILRGGPSLIEALRRERKVV